VTIRTVIRYPDERLRVKCDPVGDMDAAAVVAIVGDLIETMYAAKGQGLSAPQIGVRRRIFVIDTTHEKTRVPAPQVFIDPEVTLIQDRLVEPEGCLSFPGITVRIPRASAVSVKMRTIDALGSPAEVTLKEQQLFVAGAAAVAIQHENDHLDGVLLVDRLARAARRGIDKQLRKNK